jgi:prepilin-type N-terminal cleavage/methylation domain-containing protein
MRGSTSDLIGRPSPLGNAKGFTLIEIILAIVIIGIVVVSMMNVFSGLKDIKKPEYAVQASFLALKQIEAISKAYYDTVPAAGTYTCAQFSATLTTVDCTNAAYVFSWLVENSTMTTPNVSTGSADKVKKVTLTVTRTDGNMGSMKFYTLFSPLSTE